MEIGVEVGGEKLSWADAYARAQDPLRPWPYTADMLALMQQDEADPDAEPGIAAFTPTRLLTCHRQAVVLEQQDYYLDAEASWPLVRGHMVHALMEKARYPGALTTIRETRMRTLVETHAGPQLFTAKPDLIVLNRIAHDLRSDVSGGPEFTIHLKVVDYKSKNDIKHDLVQVPFEHELQVNMYAWIAHRTVPALLDLPEAQVVVDELEVDYIDMRRVRRFTSAGWLEDKGKRLNRTPPYQHEVLRLQPIRLWDTEKVGRFITRRIEERLEARETLPPCSEPEDSWKRRYCAVCRGGQG